MKKEYKMRDTFVENKKLSKCGHISKIGRYFKCENCLPELEDDTGDWIYCEQTISEDEEE